MRCASVSPNPRYAFLRLDAPIASMSRLGRPDLTAEDVLLACAGLARSRFLFACYAWLADDSSEPELIRLSLLEAVQIDRVRSAHARLPYDSRKGALTSMIKSALKEHQTSVVCKTCNGVRERVIDHKRILCDHCKGSGREPRSGRKRAEEIGKDSRSYARYWKETYECIYLMFADWDHEICRSMSRRLVG